MSTGGMEFTAEESAQFAALEAGNLAEPDENEDEGSEGTTQEPAEGDGEKPAKEVDPEGQQASDGKQKTVPHQALHEERTKRQEAERELRELREFRAVMQDRYARAQAEQAQREQQQELPQAPNPDEDPFGFMKYQAQQLEALRNQLSQRETQQREISEQQQRWNDFTSSWTRTAQAYNAEHPEFGEAYNYLGNGRQQELRELGYSAQDAFNITQKEEADIVWRAQQAGKNPAEALLQIAKNRGFRPQAQQQSGNADAEEKIARTQRGITQSRSLSQAGGSSGKPEMTAQDIAKMSDSEFSSWMGKKGNEAAFYAMMSKGGR